MGQDRSNQLLVRGLGDVLLDRAQFLNSDDRLLIEQVIGKSTSAAAYARITRQSPRVVQKRLKTLLSRLNDPRVIYILSHHRHWPRSLSAVALEVCVRRRHLRQVARQLQLTLHQVRQHVQSARGIVDQALNPRRIHRTAEEFLTHEVA